ncbi:MAG: RbsD or FucU transport [Phycisphaeraceae bacterium]|nr:MAG: RbsD or FucU transport [Phycisphaeraceae bacterium]
MLKGPLVHPELLAALAAAGHGSRILISDFNYPHATRLGPNAQLVFANFAPGLVRATDILACIAQSVPIEAAGVMQPATSGPYAVPSEPEVWADFRAILARHAGFTDELERIERFAFYEAGSAPDVCLTIATGETSYYANILLTIGAIPPKA